MGLKIACSASLWQKKTKKILFLSSLCGWIGLQAAFSSFCSLLTKIWIVNSKNIHSRARQTVTQEYAYKKHLSWNIDVFSQSFVMPAQLEVLCALTFPGMVWPPLQPLFSCEGALNSLMECGRVFSLTNRCQYTWQSQGSRGLCDHGIICI